MQLAYDTYKIGREYEGSTETIISIEKFAAQQPMLVWLDPVGDYLVFLASDYAPLVECGKPVIYLYPTAPLSVNVQVEAAITTSEPTYNQGWNVWAKPSGQLTTASGEQFNSLFWEGKGKGVYPEITKGRVVARINVAEELSQDLTALGLNDTEIADFLEFWLPRMPNSKYIRLTWLQTKEMNALAPLHITPQPDTIIRVFLDFAGQDTATTNLPLQKLTTIPRRGFTVVEWGGLLE